MWPPRFKDLIPCDYYLWGHLKSVVYNPIRSTIDELKAKIEREIKKIIKKNILNSGLKRCHLVISA